MCGRFSIQGSAEEIIQSFGIQELLCDVVANYNAAPTQQIYVVLQENEKRLLTSMRWGLIPAWAKDISFGNKTINARAETAMEKPSFREAFQSRRCLIIANGYYEWKREGKEKIPMYISPEEGGLFAMAGLWERWSPTDPSLLPPEQQGADLDTCTILTTPANRALQDIHERMPAVLDAQEQAEWLDENPDDIAKLHSLLKPSPETRFRAYEVSSRVNQVRYNAPDCTVRVVRDTKPKQASLFDF